MHRSTSVCTPWSRNARREAWAESVVQRSVSDAADESAAPVLHRHEHRIAAQLERWLHYLSASVGSASRHKAPEMKRGNGSYSCDAWSKPESPRHP